MILKWTAKALKSNEEVAQGKGSIGLQVPGADREKYVNRDGSPVHLHLLDGNSHQLLTVSPSSSFWTMRDGELIDVAIREWVGRVRGFEKWLEKDRPKVNVWPLGNNCFAVLGFENSSPTES